MADAASAFVNPLNEENLREINLALSRLDELDVQLSMAESAGFSIADQREQSIAQRAQLMKIKQVYFPNR